LLGLGRLHAEGSVLDAHRPLPSDAVFAASDTQAIGVLEAARGLGISVPGELSVIRSSCPAHHDRPVPSHS
jgi:LacI family transcriptional regulator, xylobiose transport system transcriptional regulator